MGTSCAPTRRTLTKGAAFFLGHALERQEATREPQAFQVRVERLSGLYKLLQGDLEGLSQAERAALRPALRSAQALARAARLDARWPRLRLSGDPAGELAELEEALSWAPAITSFLDSGEADLALLSA